MEHDDVFRSVILFFVVTILQIQTKLFIVFQMLNRGRQQDENFLIPRTVTLVPPPPAKTRSHWMKVRSKDWWERIVLLEFTDQEWKQNFRMSRASFMKLCSLMESYMAPEDVTVRAAVPVIMRIAVVLYKLGSCAEYRVVANQFGISKSSITKFVYMFCKGMVQGPIKQLIRAPTEEEAKEIARRFEASHHIPQIMGLIDGTHIPILPPSDGYKDFVNRKGWPSYVLQAVVDDKFRFWNISCKMPGSAHDANALRQSDLFKRAHLLPKGIKTIGGKDTNLLIVGDPAYPLLDWLIKGYSNSPRLTPEQESFNTYISSVRVGVEMTFGLLKSRWRVLLKRSDFHFTFAPTMIATCCALHNFCQNEEDQASNSWLEEACDRAINFPQPNQPVNLQCSSCGSSTREVLTTYLATTFPLRTGHLH
uniref:DDE Tnp4 domain-containing protein n=2 Tax=Nothobranchius pienaari TaxID=704102 RepID=A0A1A8L9Q0_9TELE